jgi:para-nitrobenzyl esterase
MAQIMCRYWIRFARTGNPNGSGFPNWPAYDLPAASYLELGTQTKRAAALHDDAFRLIKRLYAARLAALAP